MIMLKILLNTCEAGILPAIQARAGILPAPRLKNSQCLKNS